MNKEIKKTLSKSFKHFPEYLYSILPYEPAASSGNSVILIFPEFIIKDFLTRLSINDEIQLLTQVQGDSRFYQMLDYINNADKIIIYENLRPILDSGGNNLRLMLVDDGTLKPEFDIAHDLDLLKRLIMDVLITLTELGKIGWYHGDTSLDNIGYRYDDNKFILFDYENTNPFINDQTLKTNIYKDMEFFLEDLVSILKKQPKNMEALNYVTGLLNLYQETFTKRGQNRKRETHHYDLDDILRVFDDYNNRS